MPPFKNLDLLIFLGALSLLKLKITLLERRKIVSHDRLILRSATNYPLILWKTENGKLGVAFRAVVFSYCNVLLQKLAKS